MSNYLESKKPKYRKPERDAICRVCEVILERNKDYMISWYSSANRGQNIHICPNCVKALYEMLPDE